MFIPQGERKERPLRCIYEFIRKYLGGGMKGWGGCVDGHISVYGAIAVCLD